MTKNETSQERELVCDICGDDYFIDVDYASYHSTDKTMDLDHQPYGYVIVD